MRRAGDVGEEAVGLVGAGGDPQGLQREAGVADPGVAVVPVAATAHRLGQRRGRGGDHRSGRIVGQGVQDPAAVVDQVPRRALVGLVQVRPGPPGLGGAVQPFGDLGLAPQPGRRLRAQLVVEGEAADVSLGHREGGAARELLDGQRERAAEGHHRRPAPGHDAAVDHVEEGVDQPVLGPGDVLDGQLDGAGDAGQLPEEGGRGVGPQLVPRSLRPTAKASTNVTVPVAVVNVVSSTRVRSR